MIFYNIKENMLMIRKESAFLQICRELGEPVRKLEGQDRSRRIGDLVQAKETGPAKQKNSDELPELLIFSTMPDEKLDRFLALYKERGLAPIALKAVVTPYNMAWTLDQLVRELTKEREMLSK